MEKHFAALQAALDGLDAFLNLQALDLTPVVLTHPTSKREAHREHLKSVLDSLNPQLEMIQQLHARVEDARNAVLRRRSMCYMAQHPISSIPPEVLQIVFSYTHPAGEGDTSVARTLSQVCSEWRRVVRGYRAIWRSMTLRGPRAIWRLALPLSLSGNEDFRLTVANEEHYEGHAEEISTENALRERLSSLVWTSSASAIYFLHRIVKGRSHILPNLRVLRIVPAGWGSMEIEGEQPMEYPMAMHAIEAPALEYLHISRVPIMACPTMPHVRRIRLERIHFSVPHILSVLRDTPELEELTLEHVRGTEEVPLHFHHFLDVNLAFLRILIMNGVDETTARSILGFCQFPKLCDLIVWGVDDHKYDQSAGTLWYHRPPLEPATPGFERSTLPNALYKAVSSASVLRHMGLGLPHYAVKAAISALFPRPGEAVSSVPLSDLRIQVTEPLSRYQPDALHVLLRGAHTHDISSSLGELLLEALSLRSPSLPPLAYLNISACMCDGRFRTTRQAKLVSTVECECPPDHSDWFESGEDSDDE